MAFVAAPLLMTNLTCEMLFVLHQRLCAQSVSDVKRQRVLSDILHGFLDRRFLDELFTPQQLCTPSAAKAVFKKLAHMSIMKLNDASMSKLFDLMVMVCKYHTLHCRDPAQLLQVTAKHLDEVEALVGDEEKPELDRLRARLEETYRELSLWKWYQLWMSLLGFFQDRKVKVSVLLQAGVQNSNGKILLPHLQRGDAEFMTYGPDGELVSQQQIEVPLSRFGGRNASSVELGTNLYTRRSPETNPTATPSAQPPPPTVLRSRSARRSSACSQERVVQEKRYLSSLLSANARTHNEAVTLEMDLEEDLEPLDDAPVKPVQMSQNPSYQRHLSRYADSLDAAVEPETEQPSFEDDLLTLLEDV